MLFGEYHHQIDEKGRIRIPARIKTALGENFMVTKGTAGCLFIFPKNQWEEKIGLRLDGIPLTDHEAQRSIRLWFSSGAELEEDNQGRFLVPNALRTFANIKKDIVIIGVNKRAEIWAREEYDAYLLGKVRELPDFDKALAGLGKYGV